MIYQDHGDVHEKEGTLTTGHFTGGSR